MEADDRKCDPRVAVEKSSHAIGGTNDNAVVKLRHRPRDLTSPSH